MYRCSNFSIKYLKNSFYSAVESTFMHSLLETSFTALINAIQCHAPSILKDNVIINSPTNAMDAIFNLKTVFPSSSQISQQTPQTQILLENCLSFLEISINIFLFYARYFKLNLSKLYEVVSKNNGFKFLRQMKNLNYFSKND